METQPISKTKKITSWVLAGLVAAFIILSGVGKIMSSNNPDSDIYKNFLKWGLEGKIILIALGEIIAALLFLIPRTSSLGVLLISAFFGGAIVTHLEHGEPMFFMPAILLVIAWVAHYLRNPEMLSSFKK